LRCVANNRVVSLYREKLYFMFVYIYMSLFVQLLPREGTWLHIISLIQSSILSYLILYLIYLPIYLRPYILKIYCFTLNLCLCQLSLLSHFTHFLHLYIYTFCSISTFYITTLRLYLFLHFYFTILRLCYFTFLYFLQLILFSITSCLFVKYTLEF